jgi:hypothetical protein
MNCTVTAINVKPIRTVDLSGLLEGVVLQNFGHDEIKGTFQSGVIHGNISCFLDETNTIIRMRPVSKLFCMLPTTDDWRQLFPARKLMDKNIRFIVSKRMLTFILSEKLNHHIELVLRLKKVFLLNSASYHVRNVTTLYEQTEATMFEIFDVRQFLRWNYSPVRSSITLCHELCSMGDYSEPNWEEYSDKHFIVQVLSKAFKKAMKFI